MDRREYQLLRDLLPWVARYEAEGGVGDVGEFAIWLVRELSQTVGQPGSEQQLPHQGLTLESMMFRQVVQIFRRLKQETKAASEGLPINHLEEFVMLMIVLDSPGIRKTDLVTQNRMETSSGNDMVNRLIRGGWLREEPDRRYRRLYITAAGQEVAIQLMQRYTKVAIDMASPLDLQEKILLVRLLHQVDGGGPLPTSP